MWDLFKRQSNQPVTSASDRGTLINVEIEAKTQINLTKKDLATIVGLFTAGTAISLCLVIGGSQETPASDAQSSVISEEINQIQS